MATLNPEQRLAIKKLEQTDIVEYVKWNYYRVTIKFVTGIEELWIMRDHHKFFPRAYVHRFPESNLFSGRDLPIYAEFESHPLNKEEQAFLKPFFIIQRKDINRAGFIDIRLAMHSLVKRLLDEKWIELKYPSQILEADLDRLRDCDSNRFFVEPTIVSAYLKYGHPHLSMAGRALIEHFLQWGDCSDGKRTFREAWDAPSLCGAIQEILMTAKDITRSTVVRYLGIEGGDRHCGPRYFDPGLYYSLIKNFFGRMSTIYDHTPRWGSKLLAASLIGSEYVMPNIDDIDRLSEMASFVGCTLGGEKSRYDISILSDTKPLRADVAIPLLDKFLRKSLGTLILVHRDSLDEIVAKFNPKKIISAQLYPNFLIRRMGYHYFLIY